MRYCFFTFLCMIFLLDFSLLKSQPIVVSGIVYDSLNSEPLTGVTVLLDDSLGCVTDNNGFYKIANISTGAHKIIYRLIGYQKIEKHFNVTSEKEIVIDIKLLFQFTQLNQVVVTAGKFEQELSEVTVSMEVIKPSLIENSNSQDIEEVMQLVPGVNIINKQANIRGGSGFSQGTGSRVLVLVDDLPMLSADANDVKWDFLPLENVEQIEVIKGASSALYGASALGGVINIRTSYPKEKPFTKIVAHSGFYDKPKNKSYVFTDDLPWFSGLYILHSQKVKQLDLSIGANTLHNEGYRQDEKLSQLKFNMNTRYRSVKIHGLSYGINLNTIVDTGGYFLFWQDAENPLIPAPNTLTHLITKRVSIDPHVTYFNEKGMKIKLRSRYFNTNNRNKTDKSMESNGKVYYNELFFQKKFESNFYFTAGLSNTLTTVSSDSLYGDHKGNNVAAYSQLDKKWKRVMVSAGIRWEAFNVDASQYSYTTLVRTGLNYHIAKETFLRTSYGQGFRPPSVAEQFTLTQAGNLKIFPNPTLKPETGWSAEIGMKQGFKISNWLGYIDVAGFWTKYKNMMEFNFGYFPPQVYQIITVDTLLKYLGFKSINVTSNAQITGVELTLGGMGKIFNLPVNILAGYTYINPVNLDYQPLPTDTIGTEDILKYRYIHSFKCNIEARYKQIGAGINCRYNSFMVNIDKVFEGTDPSNNNIEIVPGVRKYRQEHNNGDIIFDFNTSCYIKQHFKISFIVKNLFNREYMFIPGGMGAQREYALQIKLEL